MALSGNPPGRNPRPKHMEYEWLKLGVGQADEYRAALGVVKALAAAQEAGEEIDSRDMVITLGGLPFRAALESTEVI
jgi:hypothetical protein